MDSSAGQLSASSGPISVSDHFSIVLFRNKAYMNHFVGKHFSVYFYFWET